MFFGPHLLEADDGRCRQTWRVADEGRQHFLEVAGRDSLQVEDRDQHLKALRSPRISRQDRGRVSDALAIARYTVAHPRLANRDRADAGHDLALGKMAMAYHALMARLGLEIRMLCEKLSNLRLDRLGQQRTRAAAQDLGQRVGEDPWLGELDDVTVGHGVSLLHWRSGGVEYHHDTPPYPSARHQLPAIALRLAPFITKAESMIHRIDELAFQREPELILCSHCDICEFETRCHARAVTEDSLSLLQGIGRPLIEEQNRKGIFTLHQYSHTFRSRRLPRRARNPSKPRYFALQARALRENKVFIHGNPTLPVAQTSIYFDIEGLPSRRAYYYLLGMLVVTESSELYHSFWANDRSDQPGIIAKFCEAVAAYPNAKLFHFGAYEVKAFKAMREYLVNSLGSFADQILGSCHNVLPVIHHHCYFPTYSNRLKDIAGFLGYQFDNDIRSGVGSIVFRERWEETTNPALKQALIIYNRQDCEALKTVCDFVRGSTALAAARENVPGQEGEVIPTESLRKSGEGNRPF